MYTPAINFGLHRYTQMSRQLLNDKNISSLKNVLQHELIDLKKDEHLFYATLESMITSFAFLP